MWGPSNLSMKDNNHEGDEYVDIHGRDIPSVIYDKTGEIAFPLSELKQTGVGIYQKTQFAKLAKVDKQFNEDFNLYMLECAKTYMLENKIPFSHDQILNAIANSKKSLTDNKKESPRNHFFKNRVVEETSNNEILIQVNTSLKTPTSHTSTTNHKSVTPKFTKKSPKDLQFKNSEKLNAYLEVSPKKNLPNREQKQEIKNTNDSGKSTLRQPKPKTLEKIALDEEKQKLHEVIVTNISKHNCIWVQNKKNSDFFEKIHRLVNEEAEHQKVAQKPWKLEKVYMAPDEGHWFRCKIKRFNPLIVFFLDYGNVAEVEEIREVSEELSKIPCMAIRLTFKESEYNPQLEDEIKVKIIKQNEDGTYFVNVLQQLAIEPPKHPTPCNFYKTPPPLISIENGQTVVIIHVEDGLFYLRTKECYTKLRDIEQEIEIWVQNAPLLESVEQNQLILTLNEEDDKFYRAVVTQIREKKVSVKYLDYHIRATVDIGILRNISKSLSALPVTYYGGRCLKGIKKEHLCSNDQVLIRNAMEHRKKFIVILNDDGDFDLFDGSAYLSEQLGLSSNNGDNELQLKNESQGPQQFNQESKDPTKVYLKDITTYKPQFGLKTCLCGFYKSSDEFAIVEADELVLHYDSVIITTMDDLEPYTPEIGEVCFCFYNEQWYRCVVSRILNEDFEVIFLDFGNMQLVKKEDIRKPHDKFTATPALALPCRLINIPNHPKAEDLLKNLIFDCELYKVDIKSIDDGKWSVEIPSVYQKII